MSNLAPEAAELIGGVDTSNSAVVGMCFDSSEGLPEINGVLCEIGADLSAKAFTVSSRKWTHIGERYGAVVRASFGRFDDDSHVHRSDEVLVVNFPTGDFVVVDKNDGNTIPEFHGQAGVGINVRDHELGTPALADRANLLRNSSARSA